MRPTLTFAVFAVLLALPRAARAEASLGKYLCEDTKKPFFSAALAADGTAVVTPARPQSLPFEFSVPKPAGTARVFIAGESAAALVGSDDNSLARSLKNSFPGKDIEIINCGMGTYESRRILSVFEEALAYEPDLLIVLSGNNETGRDFCPDFTAELGRRVRKIKTRLASLSMPAEDSATAVSLALHEERLRAMAGLARKNGTPVLFCTLPANLSDFAPDGGLPENVRDGLRLVSAKKFEAALKSFTGGKISREPFSLFYSGRALESLGRPAEAAENYKAAVKYDSTSDRCSQEQNAMIRRVAAEEGQCLADLETAFSGIARDGITGGDELGDGVHWFNRYDAFVSAVLGKAARTCPLVKGEGELPEPKDLAPRPGVYPEDFSVVLSYACAYSRGQAAATEGEEPLSERAIIMLERLCRLDCAKLRALLADPEALKQELRESAWSPSLREEAAAWLPGLRRNAAEMFRRAGPQGPAARAAAVSSGPMAAAGEITPPRERPLRAGEAAGKALSDLAVAKMQAGDFAEAKQLLTRAAEADGDSLETRLNACFLAARTKDASFGEDNCDEAVYLGAYPPQHALPFSDGEAQAFFSRASFRLETGNPDACEDLRLAIKKASPAWPSGAEAGALAASRCPR